MAHESLVFELAEIVGESTGWMIQVTKLSSADIVKDNECSRIVVDNIFTTKGFPVLELIGWGHIAADQINRQEVRALKGDMCP